MGRQQRACSRPLIARHTGERRRKKGCLHLYLSPHLRTASLCTCHLFLSLSYCLCLLTRSLLLAWASKQACLCLTLASHLPLPPHLLDCRAYHEHIRRQHDRQMASTRVTNVNTSRCCRDAWHSRHYKQQTFCTPAPHNGSNGNTHSSNALFLALRHYTLADALSLIT